MRRRQFHPLTSSLITALFAILGAVIHMKDNQRLVKILFVGDVMLGRLVNDLLRKESPQYPWGNTLSVFKKADVRICNLECVVSDKGSPWAETPKVFHFRSDAKNIQVLQAAEIDLVSLANNHTLDYGYEAMYQMLEILDREDIKYAGAGRDYKQAALPTTYRHKQIQIGSIAFTDNEPPWEATEKQAGIFYVPIDLSDDRSKKLLEIVSQTKTEVNLLIVSAHWGPNWGYQPQPRHIPFAHALIDAGADIIFGHSCHVFQGIELYKARPILYSCGDFVDDYAIDPIERNDESFIFVVEVKGGKTHRLKLYPTIIQEFQAQLAEPRRAREIAAKIQRLCRKFETVASWSEKKGYLEILV